MSDEFFELTSHSNLSNSSEWLDRFLSARADFNFEEVRLKDESRYCLVQCKAVFDEI